MCPKKRKPRHFGHKKPEHVPEKVKTSALRSQEGETCARKSENLGITVTGSRNMCPKKRYPRHFGHKKAEHVPEKEKTPVFRSQEG
jgi:hypothetical protein